MLIHPAHHYSDTLYVLLVISDSTRVVVHSDPSDTSPALTAPVDISAWVPDLITLALTEPPGPASPPESGDIARVSLVTSESLSTGSPEEITEVEAELCYAIVANPGAFKVEVVDAKALVTLAASGLAIQVLSGIAARAAITLDDELGRLAQ